MNKYLATPTQIVSENGTVKGITNVEKDIDLKIDAYLETVGQILENHTNKLEQLNLNGSDNPTTGSGESSCECANSSYSFTKVNDDLTFQAGIGTLDHCLESNANSIATLADKMSNMNSGSNSNSNCECANNDYSFTKVNDDLTFQAGIGTLANALETNAESITTLADKMSNLSNTVETKYVNLETYKATYQVKSSTNDNELLTSTRVTTRIDIIGDVNGTSINNIATAVNNLNTKINLVDGSVQAYAEIIESNKTRITALEENQTPTDLTELESDVSMLKTAVQNHNTKITTLESKDCLTRELTVKPYENYTQDQCDRWGVDKNASMTLPADQMIQGAFMLVAANQADFNYLNETTIPALETRVAALESASATTASDDLVVIDQQISTLNNRVNLLENNVTNNTTKIGVHTTDIAALQNRVVDLETQVSTQATIISELLSRIEALEGKS